MSISKQKQKDVNCEKIINIILNEYKYSPELLRGKYPTIYSIVESMVYRPFECLSPFGLTQSEKEHRIDTLFKLIEELENDKHISQEKAKNALEQCAVLLLDDSLPNKVDYALICKLLYIIFGKPLSKLEKKDSFQSQSNEEEGSYRQISIIRGVNLILDRSMHIIEINIIPTKIEQRKKALKIVGLLNNK